MSARLLALLLLFTACGGTTGHTLSAQDYGRTCVDVIDCVPIYEGVLTCCGGGCPNTAIRADELTRYMSDVAARMPTCNPALPCAASMCSGGRVACTNGVCELLDPPTN